MEFGQTLDHELLKELKMDLPALDSAEELAQIERLSRAGTRIANAPKVYVGVPIWSHSAWVGTLYPEGSESTSFLREYAKQFQTVEVNSTFYAIPSAEIFGKWKASVPATFRFCPKFPKSLSHSLNPGHPDLKLFSERIISLGENLGVTFLQLPEHFSFSDRSRLFEFLKALPRELKVAVELRNTSFFENQRLKPEMVELLAKSYAATASVDTPLMRGVAHVSLTSTRMMVRFLGANLHESNLPRLRDWARRAATWCRAEMKELYFLVHEPDNTYAPECADLFIKMLNEEMKHLGMTPNLEPVQWNHLL